MNPKQRAAGAIAGILFAMFAALPPRPLAPEARANHEPALKTSDVDFVRTQAAMQSRKTVKNVARIRGSGAHFSWYALYFDMARPQLFITNSQVTFFVGVSDMKNDGTARYEFRDQNFKLIDPGDKRRMAALVKDALANVDPNHFIEEVKGRPDKNLYVVLTPFCRECGKLVKSLRTRLDERDNVRIRYMIKPLDSNKDTERIAQAIYCDSQPLIMLHKWFEERDDRFLPVNAKCDEETLKKNVLPFLLNINKFPTLFYDDGERHEDPIAIDAVRAKLGLD